MHLFTHFYFYSNLSTPCLCGLPDAKVGVCLSAMERPVLKIFTVQKWSSIGANLIYMVAFGVFMIRFSIESLTLMTFCVVNICITRH